jgi:cytochrome c oxidase subunit 2
VRAPAIAHLGETYLASQLGKFRSGERGGSGDSSEAMQMRAMALALADDAELADVAAYVASLPASAGEQTIEGNASLGADYYNQFCGACHGPAAEGNPALDSPALAGASDWYLLAQLRAFRDGVRGSHPDDRGDRQMRAMAAILPHEQALQDVVAFIAAIGRPAE